MKEKNIKKENRSRDARRHSWKYDLILLAFLAAAGIGIFLFYRIKARPGDDFSGTEPVYYVQVEVNSRVEQLIPLTAHGDYTFSNIYSKGENVLHIEDGGVSMISATCPDQVCVYQGVIEPPTIVPIVCMPNVVYVSIVESSEIRWDGIREEIVPKELRGLYESWLESTAVE